MFQKNDTYQQNSLFSFENQMSDRQRGMWSHSFEQHFFNLVFRRINEELFSCLFSASKSRPNAPVNQLIGALILMHRFGWTYEELGRQLNFNMLSRMALGIWDMQEDVFCEKTLFNFQHRLSEHWIETGVNLLEEVFDSLTAEELKRLKLKTDIQRGDSFLAASNIAHYSRLRLLIEVLRRLHRILPEEARQKYESLFRPYMKQSSGQYIYRLPRDEMEDELTKLGQVYHQLFTELKPGYGSLQAFEIFERIWQEHFTEVENRIEVKANKELSSDSLQSPDDLEATYRQKREEKSRGFSIHITETASPENPLQLLTDVAVATNNTDDSEILKNRIGKMKEKSPDLNEYHTDGGYGSETNDALMEEADITHAQTAIRGRKARVEMEIHTQADTYEVACEGGQRVTARATRKRFKAVFDPAICQDCPLKAYCPTKQSRKGRTWYFKDADARKHQRWRNIKELPPERQRIRPNVEASVRQMQSNMKNHKLKVRGLFKAMIYAFATAIATNAARIAQFELNYALFYLQNVRSALINTLAAIEGREKCRTSDSMLLEQYPAFMIMN